MLQRIQKDMSPDRDCTGDVLTRAILVNKTQNKSWFLPSLRNGLLRDWPTSPEAKQLLSLYGNCSALLRAELRYRLHICPFEELDRRVPRDAHVLDLGCGYALLSNLLALKSPSRQVTGMEIQASRVRTAWSTIGRRGNLGFILGDILVEHFAAPDCIVMNDVLHHIPHEFQIPLVGKCYENLPPGGLLLIKDVDKHVMWKYAFNYLHDITKNHVGPICCISGTILVEYLQQAGFKVEVLHLDVGYPYPHVLYICSKPA